tara:strand:- start:3402 stop:3830 length:429 start_codon:yes stop_codon:yes gene_type:complete
VKFFLNIKIIFFLCSFAIIYLLFSPFHNKVLLEDIFGVWIGSFNGRKIEISLNDKMQCKIKINDSLSNSIEEYKGTYYVDFSKKPIPLTIKKINKLDYALYTTFKFLDKNSIRLSFFSKSWKFRSISIREENSIILIKNHNI